MLDIADMYENLHPGGNVYRLGSIVCYYGQHYMAFVLMADRIWHVFDDTRITAVGLWPDVIKKCTLGRIQASVMFYQKQ